MVNAMSKHPALTGYQFDEAQPDLDDLLWEAHEVLACLSALVQHSNDGDPELVMSDDARRGLGRILKHCEKITIDAIGIAPSRRKEVSHE